MGRRKNDIRAAEQETNRRVALLDDKRKAANDKTKVLDDQLKKLVANRQKVINPYANMKNQFAGMTNKMANLGVATRAAEFQAEQADTALANTLDAMRASGAGSGGATALAQAALQSKRGISATLQNQEAANQKLAAQGAQTLQQQIAQGAADIQKTKADGEKFRFGVTENREMGEINRASKTLDNQRQAVIDAENAITQARIGGATG